MATSPEQIDTWRDAPSKLIAATIETRQIKPDEKVGGSRKYARYLPFWA